MQDKSRHIYLAFSLLFMLLKIVKQNTYIWFFRDFYIFSFKRQQVKVFWKRNKNFDLRYRIGV